MDQERRAAWTGTRAGGCTTRWLREGRDVRAVLRTGQERRAKEEEKVTPEVP